MRPEGEVLEISNSTDFELGDKVYITFPPLSIGSLKFGSEAVFTVSQKTGDGRVRFTASDGTNIPPMPIGGTKSELLRKLKNLTNFNDFIAVRPYLSPADPMEAQLPEPDDLEYVEEPPPMEESARVSPSGTVVLGLGVIGLMALLVSRQMRDEEDDED